MGKMTETVSPSVDKLNAQIGLMKEGVSPKNAETIVNNTFPIEMKKSVEAAQSLLTEDELKTVLRLEQNGMNHDLAVKAVLAKRQNREMEQAAS